MQLKVKRLDPRAVIPKYQSDGAACFDLVAIERKKHDGCTYLYKTGLAFEVPDGQVMLVYSRSGHGINNQTRLTNCVGVIDSDYRGEILVKLIRDDGYVTLPQVGERVAQAMLMPVDQVKFIEVDELSETKRGANGMGSTGK